MVGLLQNFDKMDALNAMGAGLLNASIGGNKTPGSILMQIAQGKQQPAGVPFQGTNPAYHLPTESTQTFQGGSSDVDRLMHAIGKLESGNKYSVLGPTTKRGDRAYGQYQVMGANIPSWTKEVLGYSMTPEEFLSNPAAQDAVARSKLGAYLAKYGNINDASSMWFSGRPLKGNNSRDVIGTSVPQYVSTVNKYY